MFGRRWLARDLPPAVLERITVPSFLPELDDPAAKHAAAPAGFTRVLPVLERDAPDLLATARETPVVNLAPQPGKTPTPGGVSRPVASVATVARCDRR